MKARLYCGRTRHKRGMDIFILTAGLVYPAGDRFNNIRPIHESNIGEIDRPRKLLMVDIKVARIRS